MVLSKCDQPALWINRHHPEELAKGLFPETHKVLRERLDTHQVEFFAVSSYGRLGVDDKEPNAYQTDGGCYVLKDPSRWKPFGLVSPIYWLATGKRNKQLDSE